VIGCGAPRIRLRLRRHLARHTRVDQTAPRRRRDPSEIAFATFIRGRIQPCLPFAEITPRAFPLVGARGRALRRLANATRAVCETVERKAGPG
jgi:hypothetical protein